ncbi:MAG: 4'-phosphopantetheinyl transferase superfamily protein [Hyphomicrobiaceae bacterium]
MSNTPIDIDVHVWSLDLPEAEREALAAALSSDEIARASRFVFERDRHRFAVGRGRMRAILAGYCNAGAAALTFSYGPHGKPRLANCDGPHFNLSHSDDLAVLAVSSKVEVGADIEKPRHVEEGVALRFFSPAEVRELAMLPVDDWLDGFFRCWTRKEAVLKALGTGLSTELDTFDVSLGKEKPPQLLRMEGDPAASRNWWLGEIRPSSEAIIAVAARTEGVPVQIRPTIEIG